MPQGPGIFARGGLFCAVIALLSVVSPVAFPAASPAPMPGPAPARPRGFSVLAIEQGCERCHAEIAEEWRASFHRQSHSDPLYQRSFAREPLAFCEHCHDPEGKSRKTTYGEAEPDRGVGCVSCHLTSGTVLAAPAERATPGARPAPHPLRREAAFGSPAACARCHEFPFPEPVYPPSMMQQTVSEHQRSAHADRSCADCHMPLVEAGGRPHRSHAFAVREPEFLRASLQTTAHWEDRTLVLDLAPDGVGHAVPTGDLFRRLRVQATLTGQPAGPPRYLARHSDSACRAPGSFDDRPGVDPAAPVARVSFDFSAAAEGSTVTWELRYERVDHPEGCEEDKAVVESFVPLAGGEMQIPPP